MKFENFFRTVLIIISLGIFCYQMNNAWNKLASQPMMDKTTLVPLDELDIKPLVTICLDVKPDLEFVGISDPWEPLRGSSSWKNKKRTWVHKNMTFDEIMAKAYQADIFDDLLSLNFEGQNFIFPFGSCRRLKFSSDMSVVFLFSNPNYTIYITDPAHTTKFSIDTASHTGSRIKISNTNKNFFMAKIKLFDLNNPEEKHLCKKDPDYRFIKCVDEYIQNDLQKKIGCVPPFLSDKNQCTTISSTPEIDAYIGEDFIQDYVWKLASFKKTSAEQNCSSSCMRMEISVQFLHSVVDEVGATTVSFDPDVEITSKVLIYGCFEFIIDAGSSLGLWLGLSALGIWDHIVEYTRKINSFFKYK